MRQRKPPRQTIRFILLFRAAIIVALLGCADVLRAAETPVDFRTVRGALVFAPMPELSRAWLKDGSFTAHMVVDPETGRVDRMLLNSGDTYPNYKVLEALRRWKFRPGTPRLVRISFGTVRTWGAKSFANERRAKRMDDVLAPFLGKGRLFGANCRTIPPRPRGRTNTAQEYLNCISTAAERCPT